MSSHEFLDERHVFRDRTTLKIAVDLWITNEESAIETYGRHISDWDVSNVNSMEYMFYNVRSFNQPLDNWNVGNVTNMLLMFDGASSFNQSLNTWNVSNVTNMLFMFDNAKKFDQDISNWDIHANTTMDRMFINTSVKEDFKPSYEKTVIRRKQKKTNDRYKAMSALTQIKNSTPHVQLPPDLERYVTAYVAGKKKKQKKQKKQKKATKKKKKQTTKKKLSV